MIDTRIGRRVQGKCSNSIYCQFVLMMMNDMNRGMIATREESRLRQVQDRPTPGVWSG